MSTSLRTQWTVRQQEEQIGMRVGGANVHVQANACTDPSISHRTIYSRRPISDLLHTAHNSVVLWTIKRARKESVCGFDEGGHLFPM